jgi:hypothetical protein
MVVSEAAEAKKNKKTLARTNEKRYKGIEKAKAQTHATL